MIKSKKEYREYLEKDRIALNINKENIFSFFKEFISPNYIWLFQKKLRKLEYYKNCKTQPHHKLYYYYLKYKFKKISLKLGFSIPINVFGPGLAIVHYGTIVVNSAARIGANCRIHACTNIGASGGEKEAPKIGNNVYIGPGAKIYGNIILGNNLTIGANTTIFKSINEDNIMIAGNPGKKIKEIEIKRIIKHI